MWLGVHIYTDGMDASFIKAKNKSEIVKWFKESGFDVSNIEKGFHDAEDGICHEVLDEGLNMGYIVNLNAKKQ